MFIAMMCYLLLVLIRPQDYPAMVDSVGLPLQPIMLITAAAFWMLSPRKDFDAPQYQLLLMFFGVLLVSHVFNGWIGGAIEQVGKFAPVVLAFAVFANGLDRRSRILKFMAVYSVCAAVLAVHGIGQRETGLGWTGVEMSQGTRIQYVGIFNDPNDLGLLFVSCVPMAVYLSSRGGLLGLRRLFWLAITGLLVYGVYLTDSRGALLGLLSTMGVFVWQRKGLIVAGVLGAMAVAVLLLLPSRFSEIDAEEESAQGRVESWYEGLQMFQEYPLFGVGPDMYTEHNPLTAHNSFVLILAETGIVGYTLWLAFLIYCFRMMWRGSRPQAAIDWEEQDEDGPDSGEMEDDIEMDMDMDWEALDARVKEGRAISMALLLSLIGFFVAAFFLSRSYVIILYLLTAMVVAHYADIRRDDPSLPHFVLADDALLWPVVGLGSAIFLYIVVKILLVTQ